jgi:hypothetical protein
MWDYQNNEQDELAAIIRFSSGMSCSEAAAICVWRTLRTGHHALEKGCAEVRAEQDALANLISGQAG